MKQLDQCKSIDGDIESGRKFATQTPGLAQNNARHILDYVSGLESVQRRCQTVTPQIEALRAPLLLKAMQGGEAGAAAEFVKSASRGELVQPGRQELVLNALQADALRGDVAAMQTLASPALPYEVPPAIQRPSESALLQIQERWLKGAEGAQFETHFQQQLAQRLSSALLGGWTITSEALAHTAQRLAKLQSAEGGMDARERALAGEMLAAHERRERQR